MIVEDDAHLTVLIKRQLVPLNVEIVSFLSGREALEKINELSPTLIILNYSLLDITAFEFLKMMHLSGHNIPFLIITGQGDELIAVEMMKMGATEYLIKDSRFLELLPQSVQHILNNIEQKSQLEKAEKTIIERERMLNSVITASHDAIVVIDELFRVQIINPATEKMLDISSKNLIGISIIDIFPDSQKEIIKNTIHSIQNKNDDTNKRVIETLIRKKNQSYITVEISIAAIQHDDIKFTVLIFRDISERKIAEEKLEESWKLFKTVIENIPIQVFVKDVKSRKILFRNKWGHQMSNITSENMVGKTYDEIFPIEIAESFKKTDDEVISTGDIDIPEWSFIDVDGIKRYMHTHKFVVNNKDGKPLYILGTSEDITDRKKCQEEQHEADVWLHEKQKMEALGTMAGGICHEINNPLTGIMNYGQLIVDMSDDESTINEFAQEIINESERIASIIASLQGLCKSDTGKRGSVDLVDVMANVEQLVKTTFRHDKIKLDIEIDSNIPKVYGNIEQYQHVMLNMLTNARDALNARFNNNDPKKLIKVRAQTSDKYVILTVEDYGVGVPESILHKMFDPFFTTHDRTERQGLGLAICQSIIKGHGGNMQVESKMDEYTKFIISFPLEDENDHLAIDENSILPSSRL
jgi:PAS domain S-box-containing protein